jgi:uncharacterized protein YkwD
MQRDRRPRTRIAIAAVCTLAGGLAFGAPDAGAVVNATAQSSPLMAPPLGFTGDPSGNGTWSVGADGWVSRAGSARGYGHATTERNGAFVVGIAANPDGDGYWIAAHNGGVFSHGDVDFHGSGFGILRRGGAVVDIEATPSGNGYWLFTDHGQVLHFGDAKWYGAPSMLTKGRIVDAAVTPTGKGYWLVSSKGGVYHYGDAKWYGAGWQKTSSDITGIARTTSGKGYYLVNSNGGLLHYGDAAWYGSLAGKCSGDPVVGITTSKAVRGYWMVVLSGRTFAFSPTSTPAGCGPTGTSKTAIAAKDLFDRLNGERAARGLAPLRWDERLAGESRSWSAEMARSGFRHSDLQRLLTDGRFNLVAENIAWARGGSVTAATLHVAWMESDGHRRNLLSPALQVVGIGVYCGGDGTMWATQAFGRLASSGSAPAAGTPARSPLTRADPGTASC